MKLGPLQRKSSCQMRHGDSRVDNPIATATSPELTTKYTMMAMTTALGSVANDSVSAAPPSHTYATPVAPIVTASADMLNAVRYHGYGSLTLKVHCVHAPATATIVAGAGPRRISAMRSAAYETESVQLLFAGSRSSTFHADVRQEQTSRVANINGRECGTESANAVTIAPAAITAAT